MRTKHGLHNSKIYKSWEGMISRCNYSERKAAAGDDVKHLTVIPRWRKFENFYEDNKHLYNEGLFLCRVDALGGYSPDNIEWRKVIRPCRKIAMVGRRYERLEVICEKGKDSRGEYLWLCKCDCGEEIITTGGNLRSGNTKSCGCWNVEMFVSKTYRHGMKDSRIYSIWASMRRRCNVESSHAYKDYGGRGIKVCERWNRFINFYEDMISGYADDLTLDRINPNGNYEPENCRWATTKEQARNKRNTKFIEHKGKKATAIEWQEISGTDATTINYRIKKGWDLEEAIFGRPVKSIKEISKYLSF